MKKTFHDIEVLAVIASIQTRDELDLIQKAVNARWRELGTIEAAKVLTTLQPRVGDLVHWESKKQWETGGVNGGTIVKIGSRNIGVKSRVDGRLWRVDISLIKKGLTPELARYKQPIPIIVPRPFHPSPRRGE